MPRVISQVKVLGPDGKVIYDVILETLTMEVFAKNNAVSGFHTGTNKKVHVYGGKNTIVIEEMEPPIPHSCET